MRGRWGESAHRRLPPIDRGALRILLWVGTGLAVAAGAILYCRHFAIEAPGLDLYVGAARCMLDGAPLQSCEPTFTYPPIFAFVTIPLVTLPPVVQNLGWYLVTLGALCGCIAASMRLARLLVPGQWSKHERACLFGLGILLNVKFFLATIGNQSYDAVVVFLVLIGLVGLVEPQSRRAPLWSGASLACAAALKATPLLFLPYLVVRRHYKTAAVMMASLVLVSILPDLVFTVGRTSFNDSYMWAWLHQVAAPALTDKMQGNPHTFWFASNPNNNSLRGLVGFFIEEPHRDFTLVLYTVDAIYAAVVGLAMLAARNGRAAPAIDGALLLVTMLMLSPMSSQSHYIAMVLPIFGAVAICLKGDPQMRRAAGLLLIVTVLLTNATSKDLVGKTLTEWAKVHRLLIADALLFATFFMVLAWRSRTAPAAEPAVAIRQSAA